MSGALVIASGSNIERPVNDTPSCLNNLRVALQDEKAIIKSPYLAVPYDERQERGIGF